MYVSKIIIIIYLILIIIVCTNGVVTLVSSDTEVKTLIYKNNYTYEIETYAPSDFFVECPSYPCNCTLSGRSFLGGSEKISRVFEQKNSIDLKALSFYTLTMSTENRNPPSSTAKIFGLISSRDISSILSTFWIYAITFIIGILFSISDYKRYMQSSNSAWSISFLLILIRKFLSKINRKKNGIAQEQFMRDLNIDITEQEEKDFSEDGFSGKIPKYVERIIAQLPFSNLDEKINAMVNKIYPESTSANKERYKTAQIAIAIARLSEVGLDRALKFKPSYVYFPMEYIYINLIKRAYIPRSMQFLTDYPIEVTPSDGTQKTPTYIKGKIEEIDKLIKFDDTDICVLITLVLGIFAFLGLSVLNITQSPLILKSIIILYLLININVGVISFLVNLIWGGKEN
jgi:hypothetical protein